MKINKKKIKRKLKRLDRLLSNMKDYSSETHTYYGGWSLGYFQGQRELLSDMLDEVENE